MRDGGGQVLEHPPASQAEQTCIDFKGRLACTSGGDFNPNGVNAIWLVTASCAAHIAGSCWPKAAAACKSNVTAVKQSTLSINWFTECLERRIFKKEQQECRYERKIWMQEHLQNPLSAACSQASAASISVSSRQDSQPHGRLKSPSAPRRACRQIPARKTIYRCPYLSAQPMAHRRHHRRLPLPRRQYRRKTARPCRSAYRPVLRRTRHRRHP